MSDTTDDWAAYKAQMKEERAARRDSAEQRLKNEGLNYSVHNGGAHIVIWEGGAIFDFWPGTDRWRMRDHKGQHGFDKMLAAIRERKVVAMDLSKIEERVIAQRVDAGKLVSEPFRGNPKDLKLRPSAPAQYPCTNTGRIVDNTPPWQELPTTPEEDEAFAAMMEKAYPHLKGEDE